MILEQARLGVSPMITIQEYSALVEKDDTKGTRERSPVRSVYFREEQNRYYEGGMSADKDEVWYSKAELACFSKNYQQAGKVMAICNPNARTWFQILQRSYKHSIIRNLRPHNVINNIDSSHHHQQLISMYSQDHNMVGIEDLLFPRLRIDGGRRRESLMKGISQVTRSPRLSSKAAQSYHIRVMSQKVSEPSRRFAHDIARAQWEAASCTIKDSEQHTTRVTI